MNKESDSPDKDLLRGIRGNDPDVWGKIMARYGGPVLRRLRMRWGTQVNHQDLEDALLQGLVEFWQKRRKFRSRRGSIEAWYDRLCRQQMSVLFKARYRDAVQLVDPVVMNQWTARITSHDEPRQQTRLQQAIATVWMSLSEKDRALYTASIRAEGTAWTAGFAQEFNMTPKAVRTRAARVEERVCHKMELLGFRKGGDDDA